MMSQYFYRAFEDKYRGSRDLIKSRLEFYLPFVKPLRDYFADAPRVLDLGCGRGEWIELLGEHGFEAVGVDLDEGMLAACKEKGLNVLQEDAITALQRLRDNTQTIISAFHLVEHLDFVVLEMLVREALRVLRPGGVLILETPNPENLIVGATSFYRDPTHHRPLPPELLAFVPEFLGFERTKVLRLQENPALHSNEPISLYTVFHGPSPDYAIIAQKVGPDDCMHLLDPVFGREFGLTIGTLADRYHVHLEERIQHAVTVSDHGLNQSEHALKMAHEALNAVHAIRTEVLARATAAEQRVVDLEHSLSWRITAPLRWLSGQARRNRAAAQLIVHQSLSRSAQGLLRLPLLKRTGRALLRRSPRATAWIRRLMSPSRSSSPTVANTQVMNGSAHRIEGRMRELAERPRHDN